MELPNRQLDLLVESGIQRRGALVKDDDPRFAKKAGGGKISESATMRRREKKERSKRRDSRSCQRDELLLALGEVVAARGDKGRERCGLME